MDSFSQTTNVIGAGTLPYLFIPKVLDATDQLGVTASSLITVGAAEFNRSVVANHPRALARAGVRDISPPLKDLGLGIGFTGRDSVASATRDRWQRVAFDMVDSLVQETLRRDILGSQTLWIQGMRTGHGKPAESMLRRLSERIPDQIIVIKIVIPEDEDQRPLAVIGYDLYHQLQEEGVIAVTLLTDNASPFVRRFTLDTQDRYESTALASLIAGQPQFGKNRALGEIGRRLQEQGAVFAGWSFASQAMVPTHQGLGRRIWAHLGDRSPRYDLADLGHMVRVAQLTATVALTDPDARAIAESIDAGRPHYVVFTVPMPADNTDAWQRFSNEMRRWLQAHHPNAVPVYASGQGAADPRTNATVWLQASVLFPLPAVPAPIREVLDGERSLVRRSESAFRGGSETVPASPHPNGARTAQRR